jgi:hypothetical protein
MALYNIYCVYSNVALETNNIHANIMYGEVAVQAISNIKETDRGTH